MFQQFSRALAGVTLFAALSQSAWAASLPQVQVFKTRTCGCCSKWVDHMRAAGFDVKVTEVESTAEARKKLGVPERLQSCHTAAVGGYAVEGHVPADDIKRLLASKENATGLAVPGMPMGSPGMEQGPNRQAYSVVLFRGQDDFTEYKRYPAK